MKKPVFLLLTFLILSVVSFGQRKMTPEEKILKDVDGMTKALNLTAEQVAQINPLIKDAQVKQTALLKEMCCDSNGSLYQSKELSDASKRIITDLDLQINTVITRQQQIKLQEFRDKQKRINAL
jgi:hypothetical protein